MTDKPEGLIIDGIYRHLFVPLGWAADAACRDADPEVFFIKRGDSGEDAKAYCERCDVREACLAFALSSGERHGIWGGMTTKQRRVEGLRRQQVA